MQNTYILLRNNTESTPLTVDDLKKTGLLPTDLLWVECQSVSWRHPDEIPELKGLLASTSLPVQKSTTEEAYEKYAPQVAMPPVAEALVATDEELSIPVNSSSRGNYLRKKEEEVLPEKEKQHTINSASAIITASVNTVSNNTPTINDTLLVNDSADTSFNMPATKDKAALLESLLTLPRKTVILYSALVVAGALMMLIIMGTGNNNKIAMQPAAPAPASQQADTTNTEVEDEPIAPVADSTAIPESYTQQNPLLTETSNNPVPQPVSIAAKQTPVPAKKKEGIKETVAPPVEPSAPKTAVVAEPIAKKAAPPDNINAQLLLKTNEYNVAAFGGIRNLVLTLQNNSSYFLDKVAVEIQYLNPEGAIVKKENIDFKFVPAGETASIAVNKSSRGVKVTTKIITVQTKDLVTTHTTVNNSN